MLNFCASLKSDACWNHYLLSCRHFVVNGNSFLLWILLQRMLNQCVFASSLAAPAACSNSSSSSHSHVFTLTRCARRECDWNAALTPNVRKSVLADPAALYVSASAGQSAGSDAPPHQVVLNHTTPSSLVKQLFCSRRFGGAYCRLSSLADESHAEGDAAVNDVCDLLRDGCAAYHRQRVLAGRIAHDASPCIQAFERQRSDCDSKFQQSQQQSGWQVPLRL